MFCPRCHTSCQSSDHFCPSCGFQLQLGEKKYGSRWFPLLLLILMSAIGLMTFFATSENHITDADCPWFHIKNGTLYFDADRYTGSSELNVPAEISDQTVTALGEDCFAGCETLTAVFLPDTVIVIGDNAFNGCSALRGIYLPSSIRSLGENAFLGCSAMESICLHSTVSSIGTSAFDQCDRLQYIIFRGNYAQWIRLYDADINPSVRIFCEDGSFFQSENHTQ